MLDIDEAKNVFNVNAFGILRMIKACAPLLRAAGPGSRIINTSSVSGVLSMPGLSVYCASKHAVEAISGAARIEVRQFGIRAATLNPGCIKTQLAAAEMSSHSSTNWSPEALEAYGDPLAMKGWFRKVITQGSSPGVTSAAIKDAMRSPWPRRRYVVGGVGGGQAAWSLLCKRWFLPAAEMDAAVIKLALQVRNGSHSAKAPSDGCVRGSSMKCNAVSINGAGVPSLMPTHRSEE